MFASADVDFESLGLAPCLVNSIRDCFHITKPTVIQARAIPRILGDSKSDFILGAETGSGKSLAYILPFLQRMIVEHGEDLSKVKGPPRALILVPTSELCGQVVHFLEKFPDELKVSVAALFGSGIEPGGSFPERKLVVVATPSALRRKASPRVMSACDWVVVDEADMLLEGGFQREVHGIINTLRKPNTRRQRLRRERERAQGNVAPESEDIQRQFVFVGATYPDWVGEKVKSVVKFLNRRFPDAINIHTPLLHRSHPNVDQNWVFLEHDDDALPMLRSTMEGLGAGSIRAIVFVNTVDRCEAVSQELTRIQRELDLEVVTLHKRIPLEERMKAINEFRDRRNPRHIIVSTDLASRGLDLGSLSHVIQFDFATNVTQHMHRIGRLARADFYEGQTFHVVNMVSSEHTPLAQKIRDLDLEGKPLEEVFSRRRGFRRKMKRMEREDSSMSDEISDAIPWCDEGDDEASPVGDTEAAPESEKGANPN